MDIREAVKQSNLIENVTGNTELDQSMLAWNYLISQPTLPLYVILHTHAMIMRNFPEIRPGQFRVSNVEVSGRVCPHWEKVPQLVNNWVFDMESPTEVTPKQMHIRFEHIHPFRDGNGRVGRMLYWWHQAKLGHKQTIIRYEDRFTYYKWFRLNDD